MMPPVPVLFVSHAYVADVAHGKLREIAATGRVDLTVVVPRSWRHPLGEYPLEVAEGRGYRVVPVRTCWNGDVYRFLVPALPGLFRRHRPRLVHLEDEPESWIAMEVLAGLRLVAPRPRFVLFTWQNLVRPMRAHRAWTARRVLRALDHLVVGNAAAVDVARGMGYEGRATVLPQFGVDPGLFRPGSDAALRARLGLSGFVVGFVGRLTEAKGLLVLAEAMGRLPPDVHLYLVGRGPILDAVRRTAETGGWSGRLVVEDTVPHDAVAERLRAMDCLVLPSRTTADWAEQFGHVLIEAMAAGVPVVGSDSGAIPEVIGDAGLVVPEGQAGALAVALAGLRDRPERARALAEAGLQRVAARYTDRRVAEGTLAAWSAALGEGGLG